MKKILSSNKIIFEGINVECRKIFLMIGEYLDNNIYTLDFIYMELYKRYGNTIIFSKRNLYYCYLFYKKYKFSIPSFISWNNIVVLLNKNNSLKKDIYIFNLIIENSLNNKEISYYLYHNHIKRIYDNSVNNICMEFLNLKEIEE